MTNEEFYDAEIAPALLKLLEKCRERKMSFLAQVEIDPHNDEKVIYLDPPYWDVETNWKHYDHVRLAIYLRGLASMGFQWLLSYNDCEHVRKAYEGFYQGQVTTHWSCSNTAKGRGEKKELLISTFPIDNPDVEVIEWPSSQCSVLICPTLARSSDTQMDAKSMSNIHTAGLTQISTGVVAPG